MATLQATRSRLRAAAESWERAAEIGNALGAPRDALGEAIQRAELAGRLGVERDGARPALDQALRRHPPLSSAHGSSHRINAARAYAVLGRPA